MRPEKAYQVVHQAMESFFKALPLKERLSPLFSKKVKLALVCAFNSHYKEAKSLDKEIERLKFFNLYVPYYKDYQHVKTLDYFNDGKKKILNRSHPSFGWEYNHLIYISDRWNCDHRIASLIWIVNNYTLDEFLSVIESYNEPNRVIDYSLEEQLKDEEPKNEDLIRNELIDVGYLYNLKSVFGIKTLKSKYKSGRWCKKSGIYYYRRPSIDHEIEFNSKLINAYEICYEIACSLCPDFDTEETREEQEKIYNDLFILFKSSGSWISGRKNVWRVDKGTSRFNKK